MKDMIKFLEVHRTAMLDIKT